MLSTRQIPAGAAHGLISRVARTARVPVRECTAQAREAGLDTPDGFLVVCGSTYFLRPQRDCACVRVYSALVVPEYGCRDCRGTGRA